MRTSKDSLLLALTLLCGCSDLFGGKGGSETLSLEELGHESLAPSVVRLSFSAERIDDTTGLTEPITRLEASNIELKENGDLLTRDESLLELLPTDLYLDRTSLLLLDMSASVASSGDLPALIEAAGAFASELEEFEQAIYLFDGRAEIVPISDFGDPLETALSKLDALEDSYKVVDSSRNLYGAFVEGVELLEAHAGSGDKPFSFGALTVFTNGVDQAARETAAAATSAVNRTDLAVFTVGLGSDIDAEELAQLGTEGFTAIGGASGLSRGFTDSAQMVMDESQKFYTLAYCSPKREGRHTLTLDVTYDSMESSLNVTFNADDFEGGCSAKDFQ